ncbi:MAG: glycosyltransferase, partial [Chitinophagaceae bacterium]|nr:glycosyltransferase [Rubrivivax sp.]
MHPDNDRTGGEPSAAQSRGLGGEPGGEPGGNSGGRPGGRPGEQRAGSESPATVFTIVSRNYFHFALNLMASVAEHMPGTRRVVAICDEPDGLDGFDPAIELLPVAQLGISQLDKMVVQYTILELNTAIKPFVFGRLFDDPSVERVVYFDPDIQLFSSGDGLLQRLDHHDVVLTPHLTAPLDDDRQPSDLTILQSGTYNLGFIALRRSPDTLKLLRWWQGKLERDCVVDIPRGLFTDQKWMDLVPGFVATTQVERHPGWNVAYWNLKHRHVERQAAPAGTWTVNGQPLFFFHFSGHDPRSGSVSKHQDRYKLADCTPAVQSLFELYTRRLVEAGRERFAALPYAFAKLADGTVLPDCGRRVIRNQLDWQAPLPDLRTAAGARWLVEFLTAPVDEQRPPVSRLALQLYEDRADLRAAFPDMLVSRRAAFMDWFAERAGPEAGVWGVLARHGSVQPGAAVMALPESAPQPQALSLAMAGSGSAAASQRGLAAPASTSAATLPVPVLPYRLAYRLAWKARHVLRPMTSLPFRQRMRAALLNRAFPAQPSTTPAQQSAGNEVNPAVNPAAARPSLPSGVTVIGYVRAESGVGESARATLRALATTQVPHSLVDFRVGNVSRMDEVVDERLASGRQHAISLFHINADQLPVARTFLGETPFTGTYRIGFWAWELENFPPQWHGAYAHVDEVWVPSSFCQRAIAAVSPVPVLVMPHAVEIPAALAPDRVRFGLHDDAVVFLAMADMMSVAGRKNPFAAVQAFQAAFDGTDARVQLLVKISNAHRDEVAFARLRAMTAGNPRVVLLAESLSRPALNALIDSADCFVSLHRSEGFGLVMAEAMARAKVVVATGWSGNMDFMTAHNSLPVDCRLVTLEADEGPYPRGERWAEPSRDDAVAKLRQVAGDAALRQR